MTATTTRIWTDEQFSPERQKEEQALIRGIIKASPIPTMIHQSLISDETKDKPT